MSGDGEDFLSRWSRRKTEARRVARDGTPAEQVPAAGAPAGPADPQAVANEERSPETVSLPPVEELRGLESEYRDFLRPGVDESLRRDALKKLFHDPHFNRMDGLDTYIDDYTRADPLPDAMLKAMNHAKGLVFGREDEADPGERASAPPGDEGRVDSVPGPRDPSAPPEDGQGTPKSPPAPVASGRS